MIGDPKEYRRHAAHCAQLAVFARAPQLKAAFLGLSKNGERFAIELEDAFAGHEEADILRSQARQSLAETKRLIGLLSSLNRREGAIAIGGRHCGTLILGRPVGGQPFVEEQSAGRQASLRITK